MTDDHSSWIFPKMGSLSPPQTAALSVFPSVSKCPCFWPKRLVSSVTSFMQHIPSSVLSLAIFSSSTLPFSKPKIHFVYHSERKKCHQIMMVAVLMHILVAEIKMWSGRATFQLAKTCCFQSPASARHAYCRHRSSWVISSPLSERTIWLSHCCSSQHSLFILLQQYSVSVKVIRTLYTPAQTQLSSSPFQE